MKRLAALMIPAAVVFGMGVTTTMTSAASPTMTLHATLKGSNEVGAPGASRGRGTASVRMYKSTNRICYTISVTGVKLPAAADHIHAGKAGKNGPVLVPFPTMPGSTGKATGCVTVKPATFKAISGHPTSYYVNVHTTDHPAGAVRGQLGM